jgi:hypothetical protein
MTAQAACRRAASAAQCAITLVVVLGVVGLIAWLAGIASLAGLPWILGGAFGGSFVMALARHDAPRAQRR